MRLSKFSQGANEFTNLQHNNVLFLNILVQNFKKEKSQYLWHLEHQHFSVSIKRHQGGQIPFHLIIALFIYYIYLYERY